MENKSNYEKTIEILKDNINRILNEKDQTMAWLSRKIGTNDRYMARLQRDELVPSLQLICKIAEVLRVSVAVLFTRKEGKKVMGPVRSRFAKTDCNGLALAERMGRTDVLIAIDLAYELGLRLEEICVTRVEFLISAKNTGIFVVPKGKGGQRRAIKLNPAAKVRCEGRDQISAELDEPQQREVYGQGQ